MRLRIGDVKKILGVSAETLRFFDKKGIVRPTRHPDNNYRTYEGRDVNQIVRYKYFRGLDFSLEDSVELIHHLSGQEALEMMSQQEVEVADKIKAYQEVMKQLAIQKDLYRRSITMVGKYQREKLPGYRLYANQMNRIFETDAMVNDHARKWIVEMPRTMVAFHIPKEELSVPGHIYWGYAMLDSMDNDAKKDPAVSQQVIGKSPHLPVTVCRKAQDTVFTVIYCVDEDLKISRRFQPIQEYLKAEGLQINGDLFGTLVNHQMIAGKGHRHFAVWVPVRGESQP